MADDAARTGVSPGWPRRNTFSQFFPTVVVVDIVWARYHRADFDLANDCYVLFLDKTRIRGEWKPDKPVVGPLAIGPNGDLLVPLSGELVSIG